MDTPTPTTILSASGRPLPKRWLRVIAAIWTGQAASMITSYAASFAAIWYITETTGSALMLAVASICSYLPIGIISPFGGVIADRFNRRTIMIISDFSIGIISLVLAIVIYVGEASLALVLFMLAVRGVGQAFHSPAMMASMPLLVPEKHLLRVNMLSQSLMSIASIGAPVFGILLYTSLGFHVVMFLDFIGALIAVVGLLLVKIPTVRDLSADEQHVFANLRDGARALTANRGLVVLLVVVGLGQVLFAPLGAVYPLMTYEFFGGDGYMASLVEAVFGIGMLIGSVALVITGGGKRLALLICIASCVLGVATAAAGLLTPDMFVTFVVLIAIVAIAVAGFNGPLITLVQRNVPEEKTGRALGLITAGMGLASPIGIALGGFLAEGIGVAGFFLLDGLAVLALGLVLYLPKSVRALDKAPAPAALDEATALAD